MSDAKPAKGKGRKPVSIGHYGTQDAIWRAVRELKSFTSADLICHINRDLTVNDGTVKSYLQRLVRGGYVTIARHGELHGARWEGTYTLERNTGVETPRLTRTGAPTVQGTGREQLWRTIKILREFDWRDLAIAASTQKCPIAEGTAKDYCKILAQAGYLAVVRASRPGTRARYKLIGSKNTGPRPPQIQKVKQLYDPNLDKVVWSQADKNRGDQ